MFGNNLGKILHLSEDKQREISDFKIEQGAEIFLRMLTRAAQEPA